MDCGAPFRLRDRGDVFSSSCILGSRPAFVVGFELGDEMLNGERMGDLAGLNVALAWDSIGHLPFAAYL